MLFDVRGVFIALSLQLLATTPDQTDRRALQACLTTKASQISVVLSTTDPHGDYVLVAGFDGRLHTAVQHVRVCDSGFTVMADCR
jgi:isopropylmalate/homocitrate/citramalate synthase